MKPRAEQIAAVKAAISAGRGTVSMATGAGKSLTMALLVEALQVKTLIIVPTLALKNQLKFVFKRRFGSLDNIDIHNIDSTILPSCQEYDCLILDEIHHAASRTYRRLNKTAWKGIYHRFGFTATPFRNQAHEQLLYESIAGDVIYELPYTEARDAGYVLPVEAYYVNLPKQQTDAYTWAQVYSELVVNNEYRNAKIANLLLLLKDSYTLCLVKEIRHGGILAEMTGIPFANGQTEGSSKLIQDLCSGKIKSLIATTGVCAEGVDTVPVEYVIVAGLGKAKSAFMQLVGRSVRPHPSKESAKVVIFKDRSHKFALRHFNEQKRILVDEYGVLPVELTY